MAFKNDMTMMYAIHDALRRDLDHIARVTPRLNDDPKHILRTALGWEMFKSYLELHHTAEDDMLWPPMRQALAGDSAGATLLDAMEAEHSAIDPLLVSIDAALADRESGPQRLGELTDTLAIALRGHLDHEESEGLALIDATIADEQWRAFGAESGKRLGEDVQRVLSVDARRRDTGDHLGGTRPNAPAGAAGLSGCMAAGLRRADAVP